MSQGPGGRELSYAFLRAFENRFSFETNPIYFLLHEAEYCQGEASNWSAERVRAEYPEFDLAPDQPVFSPARWSTPGCSRSTRRCARCGRAPRFWRKDDWPRLYDLDVLRANTVPVAAAVYYDDMYVESAFSQETAAYIPGVAGLGHQRIRAQRPARRRRARVGPVDGDGAGRSVTGSWKLERKDWKLNEDS